MVRSFSEAERKSGRTLMAALECFKELRSTMPMQYVITFLLVADEEGLTVGDYAKKAGVAGSVMSRHLLDLSVHQRTKTGAGFAIIETRQNLKNLREHTVHLTDKGRALFHRIHRVVER